MHKYSRRATLESGRTVIRRELQREPDSTALVQDLKLERSKQWT